MAYSGIPETELFSGIPTTEILLEREKNSILNI